MAEPESSGVREDIPSLEPHSDGICAVMQHFTAEPTAPPPAITPEADVWGGCRAEGDLPLIFCTSMLF